MVWKHEYVSKEYSDITPPSLGAHLHFDHARRAQDSRIEDARIKILATTVRSLNTIINPTIQQTLPPSSFSKEKNLEKAQGLQSTYLQRRLSNFFLKRSLGFLFQIARGSGATLSENCTRRRKRTQNQQEKKTISRFFTLEEPGSDL
jgi:hypothetical protein